MTAALSARNSPRSASSTVSAAAEYAHPPLVESWLAVEFVEGRDRFEVDADALQKELGPEWPGIWKATDSNAASDDRQLENLMGDRAIRLTTRGFAFGWLGYTGERYPRYEAIRDGFVATLKAVRRVADPAGQGLSPRRWLVRYVNRIPQGTVWMTPEDWSFFRLWQPFPSGSINLSHAGHKAKWEHRLPDGEGTLAVKFRHTPATTAEEIDDVWITLQAKGPLGLDESAFFDRMDRGREVIVKAFNELITPEAKSFWGVTSRSR